MQKSDKNGTVGASAMFQIITFLSCSLALEWRFLFIVSNNYGWLIKLQGERELTQA
jgi:hypothetical protein